MRPHWNTDEGQSLIEVLMAIVLIGIAAVALATAFTASATASQKQQTRAHSEAGNRAAVESVNAALANDFYGTEPDIWNTSPCRVDVPKFQAWINSNLPNGSTAAVSTSLQYLAENRQFSGSRNAAWVNCPATDPSGSITYTADFAVRTSVTITTTGPDRSFVSTIPVVVWP